MAQIVKTGKYSENSKNSTNNCSTRISSGSLQTTKDFSHHFDSKYTIYKDLAQFIDSSEDDDFSVPDEDVVIINKKLAFPSIHNGNNQKYVKVENFVHKLNFVLFSEDKISSRYDIKVSIGKGKKLKACLKL